MQTKEAIYQRLCELMTELFETNKDSITPSARLYDDLDIDSIDAVDLVVKLREITGKKLQPSDFKDIRTVQDVVDAVYKRLNEPDVAA